MIYELVTGTEQNDKERWKVLTCASTCCKNCHSTNAPNCYAQCLKSTDQRKLISKLNDNITDIILYEMKEVVFFTLHQKFGNVSTSNQLNPKCAVIYQSIPYNSCKHNVIWAQVCATVLYAALLCTFIFFYFHVPFTGTTQGCGDSPYIIHDISVKLQMS
jgi:hypothetical protein